MANIIYAEDISMFICVGMSIGIAKNDNRDGRKSRFIVAQYKSKRGGGVITDILWDDDNLSLIEALLDPEVKSVCLKEDTTPGHEEGYVVNLPKLRQLPIAQDFMLSSILEVPGGTVEQYKFQKGMCYANTANGQALTYKDGTRVQADHINVFCQIEYMTSDEEGKTQVHWKAGYDPHTRGAGIERRLWKTPVVQQVPVVPNAQPDPQQQTVSPVPNAPAF